MRGAGGSVASAAFAVTATGLVLVLLPSCSDGSGGGGDACTQYYDSLTSYQQRCGTSIDSTQVEANRSRFLIACANAVNAPGATNFASVVSACATKISTVSCSESTNCDTDTAKGTLADGAACQSGSQCASGGCDAGDNQCGHCIALAPVGAPCDSKTKCVKDASCNYTGGTDKGTCKARLVAKLGESCKSAGTDYISCDTNLTCVNAPDNKTATCQARSVAGTKCSSSGDCQRDLVCNNGVCDKGGAAGAPCTNTSNGALCARGLVCSQTDMKCTAVTYVAGGQTCDDTHRCSRGRCKIPSSGSTPTSTGTCQDPLPDGAACTSNSSSSGGSSTVDSPPCDRYAECINGTCQIPNPATCQ